MLPDQNGSQTLNMKLTICCLTQVCGSTNCEYISSLQCLAWLLNPALGNHSGRNRTGQGYEIIFSKQHPTYGKGENQQSIFPERRPWNLVTTSVLFKTILRLRYLTNAHVFLSGDHKMIVISSDWIPVRDLHNDRSYIPIRVFE